MLYNRDHTVMQYCNGINWISMDASKSGGSDNLGDHTATQDLDMAAYKIRNAAIPTSSTDVTNKAYVDAAVAGASGGEGGGGGVTCYYTSSTVCSSGFVPMLGTYNSGSATHYICCSGTQTWGNFSNVTNAVTDKVITSNTIIPGGFVNVREVNISGDGGPQISIGGGAWTTSGNIYPGQTLQARLTSANTINTFRSASVNIGSLISVWTVNTGGDTPINFAFPNSIGVVAPNQIVESTTITPSGYYTPVPISVSGDSTAQISINGGSWVTSSTIKPAETLAVRVTNGTKLSRKDITVSINGKNSSPWTVVAAASNPNLLKAILYQDKVYGISLGQAYFKSDNMEGGTRN